MQSVFESIVSGRPQLKKATPILKEHYYPPYFIIDRLISVFWIDQLSY